MKYRIFGFGSFYGHGQRTRITLTLVLILCNLVVIASCCLAGVGQKNRQANRLYQQGKYDEALKKYRDAQIDAPENPLLHYNIGNVLHQKKQYEKSAEEYEKSLVKEKGTIQRANIFYNSGNTMYRSGKLLEAIKYYEKCLELNPDDKDAKYNLELTRKKIKQMMQKAESRKQLQKRKGAKAEKKKGKEGEKEEGKRKKEKEAGKEEEKKEMSKEDAERLLKAAENEEKQQKRRYAMPGGERIIDKDW